jgi:heme/copper-type cytochrome/quinol oxidase subunit 2
VRKALLTSGSGALLLAITLLGGVVLWIGVPVGWLYLGSLVQGETGSLGAALLTMMVGVVVSIAAIVAVLGWLGRKHAHLREARGLEDHGLVALEGVLTVSAGIALVGFGVWFFLLSGSSPLPTGVSF